MPDCPECGYPYTSARAADECGEMDRTDDHAARSIAKRRHPAGRHRNHDDGPEAA